MVKAISRIAHAMKYEIKRDPLSPDDPSVGVIVALRDIKPYGVKKGDRGGRVSGYHNLSQEGDCWIWEHARVLENASVSGNACIGGRGSVYGSATVRDSATIHDHATVCGDAEIYDHAHVYENVKVTDGVHVGGSIQVRTGVLRGNFYYGGPYVWDRNLHDRFLVTPSGLDFLHKVLWEKSDRWGDLGIHYDRATASFCCSGDLHGLVRFLTVPESRVLVKDDTVSLLMSDLVTVWSKKSGILN